MPDLLIRGPLVLRSADAPPLERIDLRIQAGRIVEMGRGLRGRESDRVIDAADGIVIPGLVNAHAHTHETFNRGGVPAAPRSEEHTSELQSRPHLVCRLLLEK